MRSEINIERNNKEAVVLALETSGKIGSVALGFGEEIRAEKAFSGFMRHSAEIFPVIEVLLGDSGLKPDQIEHLYISNGPGSFTGLRISAAIAKMLCLACSLKIIAVDSLDVTAYNVVDALKKQGGKLPGMTGENDIIRVAAVIDAKRGQFFIAVYNVIQCGTDVRFEKIVPDSIMSSADFITNFANKQIPVCLLGDGLLYHKKEFQAEGTYILDEEYWSPNARFVYHLGREMAQKNQFADPVNFKPFYLCRPEIVVRKR